MSLNDSLLFYGRHFTERLLICEVAMVTFMGRASRSAQESACPLPPVGGHKGRILIDSVASRSLPCPRRRRDILLFQYVHTHTHTHTHSTTSGRRCCPLLSVREAIQQRNFQNALNFSVNRF